MEKFLIVGLGNIGFNYENTRHNIGFNILDFFAKKQQIFFSQKRLGRIAFLNFKGKLLILLKPDVYMNLSGISVKFWLEKIPLNKLLIITDDVDLFFGTIRLRENGNSGGHNGLKNIQESLYNINYPRLRIGIRNHIEIFNLKDFVLGNWTHKEISQLPKILALAIETVVSFCFNGIQKTMNKFNKKLF